MTAMSKPCCCGLRGNAASGLASEVPPNYHRSACDRFSPLLFGSEGRPRRWLAPWRMRLIEERLKEPCEAPTPVELAALCNLSGRQLTRGFRASCRGCSIGDHVAQYRTDTPLASVGYGPERQGDRRSASRPSSFSLAFGEPRRDTHSLVARPSLRLANPNRSDAAGWGTCFPSREPSARRAARPVRYIASRGRNQIVATLTQTG
jgi:hypothetical protein